MGDYNKCLCRTANIDCCYIACTVKSWSKTKMHYCVVTVQITRTGYNVSYCNSNFSQDFDLILEKIFLGEESRWKKTSSCKRCCHGEDSPMMK